MSAPAAARKAGPNKWVLLGGALLTVPLLVVLGLSFGNDPHAVRSPLVGRQAPPFQLVEAGGEHRTISLASLRGKPVVVNFWATWCQPCIQEHRVLYEGSQAFADQVQFIGIVYEDEEPRILDFLKRHGAGYPALVDEGGKTAIAYGVGGVPETFFISADGTIVEKYNGPLSPRALAQLVAKLKEGT